MTRRNTKSSGQKVEELWIKRVRPYFQQGEGDRQFETPPPGAARIQVQPIAAPFDQGFVRVAGDDDSGVAIEQSGNICDVVGQQSWPAVEVEGEVVGEVGGPRQVQVVVAAHGVNRSDLRQLAEDVSAADVAAVEDQFDAFDRG